MHNPWLENRSQWMFDIKLSRFLTGKSCNLGVHFGEMNTQIAFSTGRRKCGMTHVEHPLICD
jgi:hypothetical protein